VKLGCQKVKYGKTASRLFHLSLPSQYCYSFLWLLIFSSVSVRDTFKCSGLAFCGQGKVRSSPSLYEQANTLCNSIQIDHQPEETIFQFIILTFIYSSTCFGRSPAHHQELNDCSSSLRFYLRIVVIVVLFSWSGRPASRCNFLILL
jgi:hypothetical protein